MFPEPDDRSRARDDVDRHDRRPDDSGARAAGERPDVSLLTREGTATDVPEGEIKSRQKEKTSLMTEAMADAMNQAQWRNLLAFLTAAPPAVRGQPFLRIAKVTGPFPSPLYQIPIAPNSPVL